MATAVARPVHRRQGSGDAPVGTTATVTLDGRLLENADLQPRGRQQKEEEGRAPAKAGGLARPPLLGARAQPQHAKAPMTPPRVSGVSLAPLPNLDLSPPSGDGVGSDRGVGLAGPSHQHQQPHGAKLLQRRPSLAQAAIGAKAPPLPAAIVPPGGGAAGAGAAPGAGGPQALAAAPCLIAEGRGIQRNNAVPENPFLAAYLDINGTECDSVCTTPPRFSIDALTRCDASGAFGPLTPCPLSPSILTMCAQPGLDDRFAFNGASELVDMRTCQSPTLPSR